MVDPAFRGQLEEVLPSGDERIEQLRMNMRHPQAFCGCLQLPIEGKTRDAILNEISGIVWRRSVMRVSLSKRHTVSDFVEFLRDELSEAEKRMEADDARRETSVVEHHPDSSGDAVRDRNPVPERE